jgi:hypothetical protein
MAKWLRVTMPDGSDWELPASLVADPRARYYAESDTKSTSGDAFERVYRGEMEADEEDLIDWAHNNMNWSEVKYFARPVSPARGADFQEGWVNGEMEITEHD